MTDLAEYCRDVPVSSSSDEETVFSTENLRRPPANLTCDTLVIKRGLHGYGHARFDVIHIHASRETYRQLGVLLLATVFHRDEVELVLTHRGSAIRSLVLEPVWIMSRPSRYTVQPEAFTYWPEEKTRHPRMSDDPLDMPKLNFDDDARLGGDLAAVATKVVDESCDRGRVLLAELLLDAGRKETVLDEYHLEGECGYRGVGPGSAEVSIWLPGSIGFDPEVMDK